MENFDWIKGFVLPYTNFAIFLFLAFRLFKKPLLNMMAGKKSEFESLLKEANRAKEEAEAKARELSERLAKLDQEIQALEQRNIQDAEERANAMMAKSEHLARHLKEEARRMADAELARAKEALRLEIVAEAKAQVLKKIQGDVDEKTQSKLIQERIAQLNEVQTLGV